MKDALIPCPHSVAMQDPLASGYVVHHASREEIAANGGVCKKCREKFLRNNLGCVRGEVEMPVEIYPYDQVTLTEDHAAHNEQPGQIHPIVDFDYEALDRGNPLTAELTEGNTGATIADALREILNWVWRDGQLARRPQSAAIRLAAMSASLNPQLLDGQSYEEIGALFGVTKAAVCTSALQFQDTFGLQMRRSRSTTMRANMRVAALGHPPTNTGPKPTKTPEGLLRIATPPS